VPRNIAAAGQRQEGRFGRLAREYRRIAFDKGALEHDPTLEWVTPGHPLFEAVRAEVWQKAQDDLRRGALFFDLHRSEPARLDVFAASVKDGTGNTLHRRLFVVESSDGTMRLRQPTVFLDIVPAHGARAPRSIPASRSEVEAFLLKEGLEPFEEEVRAEREREVETISHHVELALNELINRQQLQIDDLFRRQQAGEDVNIALQGANTRLEDLNDRLGRRRQELASQRRFTLADVTHLGSAWVVPHPERQAQLREMVSDPEIERIAVELSMRYEREHGREPESVEAENRGFDLISHDPKTQQVRFIEVKGRSGTDPIALTANEYHTAQRLGEDFWLYAVFDCGSMPRLLTVRDPARLGWEAVVKVEHYRTDAATIEGSAQVD
jgi:hypothetical protein